MNAIFERDFLAFGASARFQVCRFLVAATMGAALLVLVMRAYATDSFRSIGSTIFGLSTPKSSSYSARIRANPWGVM